MGSIFDEIAIERLQKENAKYKEALKFYANPIHWMGLAGDSELQTVLIAGKLWDMNGWAVAENALERSDLPKPYLGNINVAGSDPDTL
jgi:hypothetical protein